MTCSISTTILASLLLNESTLPQKTEPTLEQDPSPLLAELIGLEAGGMAAWLGSTGGSEKADRSPSGIRPLGTLTARLPSFNVPFGYVAPFMGFGYFSNEESHTDLTLFGGLELGRSIAVGEGTEKLDFGLGVAMGTLTLDVSNAGCDGSCDVGGTGIMLIPTARYTVAASEHLRMGISSRVLVPLGTSGIEVDPLGPAAGLVVGLYAGLRSDAAPTGKGSTDSRVLHPTLALGIPLLGYGSEGLSFGSFSIGARVKRAWTIDAMAMATEGSQRSVIGTFSLRLGRSWQRSPNRAGFFRINAMTGPRYSAADNDDFTEYGVGKAWGVAGDVGIEWVTPKAAGQEWAIGVAGIGTLNAFRSANIDLVPLMSITAQAYLVFQL